MTRTVLKYIKGDNLHISRMLNRNIVALSPQNGVRRLSESARKVSDVVHIQELKVDAVVGPDRWKQVVPQTVRINMDIETDFSRCSNTDDLRYSINYAILCKDVLNNVSNSRRYASLVDFGRELKNYCNNKYLGIDKMRLALSCETSHIRCGLVQVRVGDDIDQVELMNIRLLTLIGVYSFERLQKQYVDLQVSYGLLKDVDMNWINNVVIDKVVESVEAASFLTVEALVDHVAKVVLSHEYFMKNPDITCNVKVMKLNAITNTDGVGVSCTKSSVINVDELVVENSATEVKGNFRAMLAFGSNIGDRFANIREAINYLQKEATVKIVQLSSLFESQPMYFMDQQSFLNGVVEIETELEPRQLLSLCKRIEYEYMNRFKEFDNGPRIIDLDILTMQDVVTKKDVVVNEELLVIPHPRMLERSFVMEPLCELVSLHEVHPMTMESYHSHLGQLYKDGDLELQLVKVIPIRGGKFLRFKRTYERDPITDNVVPVTTSNTYVMGIMNTTPDSFSGGNVEAPLKQLKVIKSMVENALRLHNCVMIDVGGCSTRPGGRPPNEEQEISRTIELIKFIRGDMELPQDRLVLSIDTYRANIAKLAIDAGIDIINDISGGRFEPEIFDIISKHSDVAYVLTHSRGNTMTMSSLNEYNDSLSAENVLNEYIFDTPNKSKSTQLIRNISRELSMIYLNMLSKGVKRWQVILDPGIGFSKVGSQNFEIIRNINMMKNYSCELVGCEPINYINFSNLPLLIGPSRKKFIEDVTKERKADTRDFSTGSIVTSCIGFGADILRIHDVKNCTKSIRLADNVYRNQK